MGTSTFLKEKNPDIQIVGLQPSDGAKIAGIRKWPQVEIHLIMCDVRVICLPLAHLSTTDLCCVVIVLLMC